VRVYDFSGALIATMSGHKADVISVEWDHDRDEVISSSDDGTVKRWAVPSGELIADLDMAGVETDTVAISSAGTIFAGNDEGQIIVVRDGRRQVIQAHDAGIKRLVIDGGRDLLVSLSYDRMMRLWDISAPEPAALAATPLPADVWPRSCAFAGEDTLVFATFGSTYRTYDRRSGVWEDRPIEPTYGVNAVLQMPDSTVLAVGDAGVVWRDEREIARTNSLCNFLTPAPQLVFTGGQLGKVFDALTGRELYQHRSPLNCGAGFERDGVAHVMIGTYTGEGLIFRVSEPGDCEFVEEVRLHSNAVKGVAASGDWLFSVAADASATWYRISTGVVEATRPEAHDKIANGCAGLGDGWFASVSRDLKLRIWDGDKDVTVVPSPHTRSIKCVAASADGLAIATASYYGTVAVYDRVTLRWGAVERPTTAGVSSLGRGAVDGRFLAGSYDGRVYPVGL
jgi:WD40 repeat protein